MKFETYLEAVKQDVLNEIFGIKNVNVNLQKIIDDNFSKTIDELIDNGKISTAKDIFRIPITNESLSFLKPEEQEKFLDTVSKIKSGNYYLPLNSNNKELFVFKVANTMYRLVLESLDEIDITFNEVTSFGETDYSSNSLFKIPGARDELFNKIRFIIQKEYAASLKTKVFSFSSSRDSREWISTDDVYAACEEIINQFKEYLNGKEVEIEEIGYIIEDLNKKGMAFLKKYLTSKLLTAKVNQEDIDAFLNPVLSMKVPPKRPKKLLSFKPKIGRICDYDEITSMLNRGSMRTKLYIEVIRALMGDKVYINQYNEQILFSLSPIKKGKPI
jgi:hypothetical protein